MTLPAPRTYLLDANAFVEAHRKFYAFDLCPGYWEALSAHALLGTVGSIDRIRVELAKNKDALWKWVGDELPDGFFASTNDTEVFPYYGQAVSWVQSQVRFLPQAKAEASDKADTWLVAHARAKGQVLVTFEKANPATKKKVPLPDLCDALGVENISLFEMLRELTIRFDWSRET